MINIAEPILTIEGYTLFSLHMVSAEKPYDDVISLDDRKFIHMEYNLSEIIDNGIRYRGQTTRNNITVKSTGELSGTLHYRILLDNCISDDYMFPVLTKYISRKYKKENALLAFDYIYEFYLRMEELRRKYKTFFKTESNFRWFKRFLFLYKETEINLEETEEVIHYSLWKEVKTNNDIIREIKPRFDPIESKIDITNSIIWLQ